MEPRDVFDVALVVMVSVTLYFELYGLGGSGGGVTGLIDTILNLDTVYYLVIGGILGVVFVSYITIYLPQKYSQNAPK